MLLEKGAQIDALDDEGQTPLFRAVLNRHHKVVELLVEKGNNSCLVRFSSKFV